MTKRSRTPEGRRRLRSESERLRRARHPGVVELLTVEEDPEQTCLVLAYAGTSSLAVPARRDAAEIAAIIAAAATTVAELHDLGVVHGRIQASHIVIDPAGRPVLAGFGPGPEGDDRLGEVGCGAAGEPLDDVVALAELLGVLATRSAADPEMMSRGDQVDDDRVGDGRAIEARGRWRGRQIRRELAARSALTALADRSAATAGDHGLTARQFAAAVLALAPATPPAPGQRATLARTRAARSADGPADRAPEARRVVEQPEPADHTPNDLGFIDRSFFDLDPADHTPDDFGFIDRSFFDLDPTELDPTDPNEVDPTELDPAVVARADLAVDAPDRVMPHRDRPGPDPAGLARRGPTRVGRLTTDRAGAAAREGAAWRASTRSPRRGGRLALGILVVSGVGVVFLVGRHGARPTLDPVEALAPAAAASASGGPAASTAVDPTQPDGAAETPATVRVYTNGVVEQNHQRFAIGGPGDEIAVGDFGCRGAVAAVVLRPSSGQMFVFAYWAAPGHDRQASVAAVLPPGSHWQTASPGPRCPRLVARLADHTTVTVPWPLPATAAPATTPTTPAPTTTATIPTTTAAAPSTNPAAPTPTAASPAAPTTASDPSGPLP